MKLGEWTAHFIESSSVLRKGGYGDPRAIRYQTTPLPGNVGAPLIIQDIEQLRYVFETEEPRLVEGLLSVIESMDLSLLQLSNEDGRRFMDFARSFGDENRGLVRVDGDPRLEHNNQEGNFVKDKRYDGNSKY